MNCCNNAIFFSHFFYLPACDNCKRCSGDFCAECNTGYYFHALLEVCTSEYKTCNKTTIIYFAS